MPLLRGTNIINRDKILNTFDLDNADLLCLEKVGTRPSFSSAAAFVFGGIYYQLLSIVYPFKTHFPTPQEWQAHCLGSGPAGTTKARSKVAFEMLNKTVYHPWMTHDFHDAWHLANYALHRRNYFERNWDFLLLK